MAQLKSTLITGTLDVTGAISQKGIALSNTYLGKTDTATNSAKLNNQDPSYYLAWANITDKPTNLVTTNSNGKIPESYLPSYVDDVIEGYYYNSKFYKESSHTTVIAAESGKIYIDLATNKTYRWSGSAYAEISASLALGETSSTAYAGDKGKANATNIATLQTTINNALPLNAGNNVKFTSENGGITISAEGSVKKVNNQEPDNNGNVSITLDNINDGSSRKLANYLPLSGGTMTGNLTFSPVSSTSYPASSNYISWSGSTDGAAIYYRVDASDAGRLVFQTADDSNCNFVWHNTVSGNGDVMTLTGNGNLTVKGDITSNSNKVALDKDVVKLTGNQTISGTKTFSGKIINTYLQHGIIDTHPENNGTILGYYTNDWAYLLKRGYSCAARNVTQNTTIEPDECWFDTSPSYDYLSLTSTSDVVEIIIKGPAMWWTTRGGIGFGNPNWRAKNVKIEVGYTATNTGTASNPDKDIVWVTRINVTNQGNGIVFGNINGPTEAEGGHQASIFNYMRLTLTNWNNTTPRIAQIFTFNTGSIGLHNAFLSKSGGNFYGSIWPVPSNTYDLGNNSNRWASVHATTFYENGTSLVSKYLGINGTAKAANYLLSPTTSGLEDTNISDKENTNKAKLRIDLATSATTSNKPSNDGFIYTNVWDINNSKNNNSQLYIPNGYHITDGRRLSVRGCKDGTWQTSWTELAYYKDLDNYTKKSIRLWDNADLNTVTSSGFYKLMNHTQANFPHGQMIVSRGGDTIAQMVFPYADTKMYVRTGNPFNTSGGLWHDWKQVAFTDHTHTSLNTAFVFKNEDMPEGSANLASTTTAHKLTLYRNGLSIPYQMDDSNDGGILRCRGTSESNTILELATWDDYGTGETIQFNYYPTNSQATPTYSVTVPKKTGTIALTSDIPGTASSSALGLVKSSTTGTTPNRDYKVQVNDDGIMKVNVPWTDNNTTYSAGTGLSLSGTTFSVKTGYTTDANNRNYKVAADSNGNLYVNVPWSSSGTLDTSLSSSSINALQNKAVYSAFSSAVGYDNNYYSYGAKGSWRMHQYNATGNSLDIKYGVITINSQSTSYSVSFGKNFTSTNYTVVFGLYRSNTQSWFWSPIVQSKTESGFTVFLRGNSSGDNGGTIMYLAIRSN